MAGKAGHAGLVEGGSGSATVGRSRDASLISTPQLVQVPPFPIPSIVEPLFKRVKEVDVLNTEPPLTALVTTTNTTNISQEEGWGCSIIEENTPS